MAMLVTKLIVKAGTRQNKRPLCERHRIEKKWIVHKPINAFMRQANKSGDDVICCPWFGLFAVRFVADIEDLVMIIDVRKKRTCFGEPQLERLETVEIDGVTGARFDVVTERRGVLSSTTKFCDVKTLNQVRADLKSNRQQMEESREELRNELESLILPSDRHEVWMSVDGNEWQPLRGINLDPAVRLRPWFEILERVTDPFSHGRSVGDLLHAVSCILDQPDISDDLLGHIWDLAYAYAHCRVRNVNKLAAAGVATAKGLELGRAKRKTNGDQKRDIVRKRVVECWHEHPGQARDATSLAEAIAGKVNEDLHSQKLSPLSRKRIADYVRELKNVDKNSGWANSVTGMANPEFWKCL
jgi:hypothetical protein